jgi:hypothetical protein
MTRHRWVHHEDDVLFEAVEIARVCVISLFSDS